MKLVLLCPFMIVMKSPPARGRGLKLPQVCQQFLPLAVAPRTGAWIETRRTASPGMGEGGRPPHGGVD